MATRVVEEMGADVVTTARDGVSAIAAAKRMSRMPPSSMSGYRIATGSISPTSSQPCPGDHAWC